MMKIVSLVIASIFVLTCYGATCPANFQFTQKQVNQGTSNLGGFAQRSVEWQCGGSCTVNLRGGATFVWDGKTVRTIGEGVFDIDCSETCNGIASSCKFTVAAGKEAITVGALTEGDFGTSTFDIDRTKMYSCPQTPPFHFTADANGRWDPSSFNYNGMRVENNYYYITCLPRVCEVRDSQSLEVLGSFTAPDPIEVITPQVLVSCTIECGCTSNANGECMYPNLVPYSKISRCPEFLVNAA
jgi:hypothetical protein